MTNKAAEPISPVRITKDFALAKCSYFVDVQLWPRRSIIDPEGWLSNFKKSEMDHAVHLLYSFLFYSEDLVNQLFVTAFQALSREMSAKGTPPLNLKATWRAFVDGAIITYVTGEIPNVTDSGFTFARKARQLLGIPEDRIMSPDEALRQIYNKGPRDIVFVDDFVGSGDQFTATWQRLWDVSPSLRTSFGRVAASTRGTRFFYCPLLCTQQGYERLRQAYPEITLAPAHIVSDRYSVFSPESIVWPPDLKNTAAKFVRNASMRAGVRDISWRGYNDLGLAIAFHNSVPDATLPIIYWNENGWIPLIQRS